MLQLLTWIVGFVIAAAVFMLILDKFPSLTKCIPLAIFIFVLLWGAAISLSAIFLWVGIIVAIIAAIVTIIKKKKPLEMNNIEDEMNSIEDSDTTNSKDSENGNEPK